MPKQPAKSVGGEKPKEERGVNESIREYYTRVLYPKVRKFQEEQAERIGGYLYIVHAKGTRFYKVGVTQDVSDRLKQLQTGSPFELELIVQVLVTEPYRWEAQIHKRLGQHRRCGEWFELEERRLEQLRRGLETLLARYGLPKRKCGGKAKLMMAVHRGSRN